MPDRLFDVGDIQRDYERRNAGGHWFDRDTMKFFKCRLIGCCQSVPGATLFITTEKSPYGARAASIRAYVHASADITTLGEFNAYTLARAQTLIRAIADHMNARETIAA